MLTATENYFNTLWPGVGKLFQGGPHCSVSTSEGPASLNVPVYIKNNIF